MAKATRFAIKIDGDLYYCDNKIKGYTTPNGETLTIRATFKPLDKAVKLRTTKQMAEYDLKWCLDARMYKNDPAAKKFVKVFNPRIVVIELSEGE